MSNKSHEISVYVDDIPMRLSERYRPLDLSAYTDEQTVIPDLFDQHYKFNAELYALEVFEFRDSQRRQQLSNSMSKLNLKSDHKFKEKDCERNRRKAGRDGLSRDGHSRDHSREGVKDERINSIHLNAGEILKPLPKMSDNYNNLSDNSIDPNVNMKRKIVKDFESDTSSPFDYVELETIDDMQELNDVFQALHSKTSQTKQTL